jgi:hypothetical protein
VAFRYLKGSGLARRFDVSYSTEASASWQARTAKGAFAAHQNGRDT